MKKDIEIAQEAILEPISKIAEAINIPADILEPYGHDKAKVDPSKISFGTKVKMMDNLQNKEITYTILGQWESDPDRYILNFKTPLVMSLLNKVVGDELKFEINGTKYDYTILLIEVADF